MHAFEDSFDELTKSMDALFEGVSGGDYFQSSGRDTWRPNVNVYELCDRLVICVELAGVEPGNIDLQVQGEILHVRGHRPKPAVPDLQGEIMVHQMEIDSGRYHREVAIGNAFDSDQSTATYRHGYLWITLPRKR